MANDINALLTQKSWSGKEVGQAIMANLINDVKNIGKASKPLFSQEFLKQMENTLKDPVDHLTYGVYLDIYASVSNCYNQTQGLFQQFFHGYYRCLLMLDHARNMDTMLSGLADYPLIMTQNQYDRTEDKSGIAVIQNPSPSQVDENGDYKYPNVNKLDVLTMFAEDKLNNPPELIHTLIIPALQYLHAYNILIDIIGDVYEIDSIEILKHDLTYINQRLNGYNDMLVMFYDNVNSDDKRELIKQVFEPVNIDAFKPSAKSIQAVKRKIKRLSISGKVGTQLKNFNVFISEIIGGGN
jgi:hypothetical protein